MKIGMELVKKLRTDRTYAFDRCGENTEAFRAFDAGMVYAAGLLQAWLREAEVWVAKNRYQAVKLLGEAGNPQVNAEDVLRELLGTTRTEGEK